MMELVSPAGWLYICDTSPSFPAFSGIFNNHPINMNNHRVMKKGERRRIFFLIFTTSDTDSMAKKNDRWRHLFFDPTIFTLSIIMK